MALDRERLVERQALCVFHDRCFGRRKAGRRAGKSQLSETAFSGGRADVFIDCDISTFLNTALADCALRPFVFYLLKSARTSHELEIPVTTEKPPQARGIRTI